MECGFESRFRHHDVQHKRDSPDGPGRGSQLTRWRFVIIAAAWTSALYAAGAIAAIAIADGAAGGRLRAIATDRTWPWRGQVAEHAEERFARRLGLIDGNGRAMTELLDSESRQTLAREQASARADDRLHRLVMLHGPASAIAALLAIVLGAISLLAWPGWTRIAALAAITAAVATLATAMALRLLPDAIIAAWR